MMCGVGALLISLSCLLHQVSFIHTQVVPNSYLSSMHSVSLNGSLMGGGCSMLAVVGNTDYCSAPAGSVLFDGVIPIINNSTTWAGQLLVFRTPSGTALSITFTFKRPTSVNGTRIPFTGVSSIDVVMFTCPSRHHARTIGITFKDNKKNIIENISFTAYTSCDHAITIRTSDKFFTSSNETTLVFFGEQGPSVHLIYLAEVTFYSSSDNHGTVGPIIPATSPRRYSTATTSTKNTNASLNDKNTESATIIIVVVILTFIIVCFILLVVLLFLLYRKKTNKSGTSCGNVTKSKLSETEVGNRKSIENLSATDEIPLEVSGTDVYATVDKTKKNESEDAINSDMYTEIEDKSETKRPDIPEMYAVVDKRSNKESKHVDTDTIAMYAMVDKTKKKKKVNDDPETSQMYAVVDKTKKKKERKAAKVNSDAEIEDKSETKHPDISEMYAVVDKRSNKKSKQVDTDTIAMYAIVDKTKKKNKVNDDAEISQMYAVVDKTKKEKERNAAKMNSDAVCSKATKEIDIDDLD